MQRKVVVLRIPEPEEDGRVRVRVAGQVARHDDVVAVAEKRSEDSTERDVDQRRVLAGDVRSGVLRFLEVVFLQDDVVDVESAGETRLKKIFFICSLTRHMHKRGNYKFSNFEDNFSKMSRIMDPLVNFFQPQVPLSKIWQKHKAPLLVLSSTANHIFWQLVPFGNFYFLYFLFMIWSNFSSNIRRRDLNPRPLDLNN